MKGSSCQDLTELIVKIEGQLVAFHFLNLEQLARQAVEGLSLLASFAVLGMLALLHLHLQGLIEIFGVPPIVPQVQLGLSSLLHLSPVVSGRVQWPADFLPIWSVANTDLAQPFLRLRLPKQSQ